MNSFKTEVRSMDIKDVPWKNCARNEFDIAEFETSEGDEDEDLNSERFGYE